MCKTILTTRLQAHKQFKCPVQSVVLQAANVPLHGYSKRSKTRNRSNPTAAESTNSCCKDTKSPNERTVTCHSTCMHDQQTDTCRARNT